MSGSSDTHRITPAKSGLMMPPQWEPHSATWLVWPHNALDWPGKLQSVIWVFAEMARHISEGELVRIVVEGEKQQTQASWVLERAGVDLDRIEFFRVETNRSWIRDYGPIFVKSDSGDGWLGVVGFGFNGWAKYADFELDNLVADKLAEELEIDLYRPGSLDGGFVLEGGAFDVNGRGALLTTEECLLDQLVQPRNPGWSKADIEKIFEQCLGVKNTLWLKRGIAGDDTHGHIDDVCRFVDSKTVVAAVESNPRDENFMPLGENLELLAYMELEGGDRLDVIELPMPSPLYFEGTRLPASYANFYICNSCVLVPTFNDPNDREALGILAELFAERKVVGIHSVDLVWGLGSVHCLTQQQPLV